MRGPLLRFAVVNFVWTYKRLPVVRRQMPVDRHLPPPTTHTTRQLVRQCLVQPAFQDGECLGQTVLQSGHHRLVGRGLGEVVARGGNRNQTRRRTKHDPKYHRRSALPTVIFQKSYVKQPFLNPWIHFTTGYDTIHPWTHWLSPWRGFARHKPLSERALRSPIALRASF